MKVRLFTQSTQPIHFVHEGEIPPFNEPPQVLFWGQRVFVRHDDKEKLALGLTPANTPDEPVNYLESAFTYYLGA